MTRLISIFLIGFLSASCAVKSPPPSAPFSRSGPLEWRNAKWTVSLQRRPYQDFKPTSIYRITHQEAGNILTLNETSAFQGNYDYLKDDQVAANLRILTDSTGDALLIQETIPNDCGPCDNYLLVRKSADKLEPRWLRMPTRLTSNAAEFEENPAIKAVTNDTIWLQYGGKKVFKVKIDTLETVPGPYPPG